LNRSLARRRAGDAEGAHRDREAGLAAEPIDEEGWVARGMARLPGDPTKALADFERALQLNPRYLPALQNRAALLADMPGRVEEAIESLDQAIAAYPDFVPARAGRGVLLARLGRRQVALDDARESLLRDTRPATLYQVAGIYALTSPGQANDRREALRLLAGALAQGYGQELVAADHDLDSLRGDAEFQRVVGQTNASSNSPP
jgi:tetratricopeptide (TPR) repeat protein